jgi:hypothetical protein
VCAQRHRSNFEGLPCDLPCSKEFPRPGSERRTRKLRFPESRAAVRLARSDFQIHRKTLCRPMSDVAAAEIYGDETTVVFRELRVSKCSAVASAGSRTSASLIPTARTNVLTSQTEGFCRPSLTRRKTARYRLEFPLRKKSKRFRGYLHAITRAAPSLCSVALLDRLLQFTFCQRRHAQMRCRPSIDHRDANLTVARPGSSISISHSWLASHSSPLILWNAKLRSFAYRRESSR